MALKYKDIVDGAELHGISFHQVAKELEYPIDILRKNLKESVRDGLYGIADKLITGKIAPWSDAQPSEHSVNKLAHFGAVDRQCVGGRVEDADVCLMKHPQADIGGFETGGSKDLPRGILQQPDGPFEHGTAIHFDEPIGTAAVLAVEVVARAAFGAN